jgi:hypothetical protein
VEVNLYGNTVPNELLRFRRSMICDNVLIDTAPPCVVELTEDDCVLNETLSFRNIKLNKMVSSPRPTSSTFTVLGLSYSSLLNCFMSCAVLVGGEDLMRKHTKKIWLFVY